MRTTWIIVIGGALALPGCARHRQVRAGPTPTALLDRARTEVRHGQWGKAIQDLQRLTFELAPNDSVLPEVHYYVGEGYFQTGSYVEAAHEFRTTADQYPASGFAPLALLRAGDANLRLWHRPELDPSYGEAALAIYQELAGRYPETEAAARAQLHVRTLREQFAEKAYKNGMFYFRRGAFDSGIIYFKDIIANYADTPRAADALMRLADSYRAIGYKDELRETCAHAHRFYSSAAGLARSCPDSISTN